MNEKQYSDNANNAAAAIMKAVPNSKVVFNYVPKEHAMSDIYCQLIPNDDE